MKLDRDGLAWIPAGAAFGFALLTGFSIGLFVLPLALLLTVSAGGWTNGRGAYGFAVGFGGLLAGLCLPQPEYTTIGLFGLAVAGLGVVACLLVHGLRATRTR
jgi:hypothetical protein